jgi:hypothetical protein
MSISVICAITNRRAMQQKLGKATREMMDGMAIGVKAQAEVIRDDAAQRAPIDQGALRASGVVKMHNDKARITAVIEFDTSYAVVQHENLTFNHPHGGGPKYLENAMMAANPTELIQAGRTVLRTS